MRISVLEQELCDSAAIRWLYIYAYHHNIQRHLLAQGLYCFIFLLPEHRSVPIGRRLIPNVEPHVCYWRTDDGEQGRRPRLIMANSTCAGAVDQQRSICVR